MKYVVILVLCLFLTGCGDREVTLENSMLKQLKYEVEVYDEDVYLYDIIDYSEVELITENTLITTDKVDELSYQIRYEYNNKKYVTNLSVNIVDSEAPRYFGSTVKTVVKGYSGELCSLLMYGDNYDGDATCTIQGEYDTSVIDNYNISYILTDSSGNVTEVPITLKVVNPTTSSSTTESRKYYFTDIIADYKTDTNEIGIDVSKWQGDIDFTKVKEAGATFVMMRIGVQTEQNGEIAIDSYFEQNYENATNAGLKVGVYLYSIATSKKEAIEQANWVLDVLDGRNLDLPIVFDWENWSKWNSYKISFYTINNIANTFMSTVTNNGYTGMLYSSKFYLENIWTNKDNYPVWLAHYTTKTTYEGNYMMWQMCNTGRIDGIDGDVDIDILYY